MKKTTLLFFTLSFFISSAQIARTISFESPVWSDSGAGTFAITSASFTDGLYQFSSTSGLLLSGGVASEGSQSLWPTDFEDGEAFTIKTTNGAEFTLESVQFLVLATDSGILSAEGFRDGSSVGVQTTGVGFGTSIAPAETKTVIFDNAIFNAVDRVVITSTSSGFGWSSNVFDEFVFSQPTLSAGRSNVNSSVSIHPNPANNIIRVTTNQATVNNVKVYDILGKTILNAKLKNNELDISNFKSGVYVLKIETDKGVSTKRIIKK